MDSTISEREGWLLTVRETIPLVSPPEADVGSAGETG